jgi:hypothetical protein
MCKVRRHVHVYIFRIHVYIYIKTCTRPYMSARKCIVTSPQSRPPPPKRGLSGAGYGRYSCVYTYTHVDMRTRKSIPITHICLSSCIYTCTRELNPQPSTLNPQPSTLNPQLSTRNPQSSTFNPQPSTPNPQDLNPKPFTQHPKTLKPETSTLSPRIQPLNPKPFPHPPTPQTTLGSQKKKSFPSPR